MKLKRFIFIVILILIFSFCFFRMNEHYDEFSRYPYTLSDIEKINLLNHLDKDEINYMIENKLEYQVVSEFMKYEQFNIKNVLWYQKAFETREDSKEYIINFINKYKDQLEYDELDTLLKHYSYNEFALFCEQNVSKDKLIVDPTILALEIKENESVYQYVPSNLKKLSKIKTKNIDGSSRMYLNEQALAALRTLLKDAYIISESSQGSFVVYITYLSYEQQVLLYPNHPMIKKPGSNDYQLGYSICLTSDDLEKKEDESDQEYQKRFDQLQQTQLSWLKENAYKYGYTLIDEEGVLMDQQLYFELKYVGQDLALQLQKDN